MNDKAKAKAKINAEMAVGDANIKGVGHLLLLYLEQCPQDVVKVLVEGKTILASLEDVRAAASRKRGGGNCVMMTDEEVFAIVVKYYGLGGKAELQTPIVKTPTAPVNPVRSVDFDVNLDDLLGV